MSGDRTRHVNDRIPAYLDGELSGREADSVRKHCAACPECARALEQYSEVRTLLESDGAAEPLRPVWPAVGERLQGARWNLGWAFALRTSGVAIAGLLVGLLIGTIDQGSSAGEEGDVWTSLGSTLTGESGPISGYFVEVALDAGEDRP